jgi:hypothetical protein
MIKIETGETHKNNMVDLKAIFGKKNKKFLTIPFLFSKSKLEMILELLQQKTKY